MSPYTTNKIQFFFYFPKTGDKLEHFASNVAAEEKIIARAASNSGSQSLALKVVSKLSVAKKETFLDIIQIANTATRQ